jgi:hypothetical protein
MTTLETTIDADTQALHAVAEHFPNIDVVYKPTADSLPHRWEVQLIEPRQYLGTIDLTATEISQSDTQRRIILRREFLRILKETGHDH